MGFLLLLLLAPLEALLSALLRALVLFWPTMIVLGMIHPLIPVIPALGWWATFLLITLISLLVPVSSGGRD